MRSGVRANSESRSISKEPPAAFEDRRVDFPEPAAVEAGRLARVQERLPDRREGDGHVEGRVDELDDAACPVEAAVGDPAEVDGSCGSRSPDGR
jgi:hypothetical protein